MTRNPTIPQIIPTARLESPTGLSSGRACMAFGVCVVGAVVIVSIHRRLVLPLRTFCGARWISPTHVFHQPKRQVKKTVRLIKT